MKDTSYNTSEHLLLSAVEGIFQFFLGIDQFLYHHGSGIDQFLYRQGIGQFLVVRELVNSFTVRELKL